MSKIDTNFKVCFKLIKGYSGSDVWTGHLSKNLTQNGIKTEIQVYPHHYQYYPYLLKQIDQKTDADIIHTNSWSGFVFKNVKPLVVTEHLVVHEPNAQKFKSLPQKIFHKMVYLFEKKTFEQAQCITAVSDYTALKLKESFGFEAKAIHNGIDHHLFYPKSPTKNLLNISEDKTIVLFVGNLSRRKGVDLLKPIMKELGQNYILIVASGIRNNVKKVEENIYYVGSLSQEELLEYYNYADMLLFPTRLEGLSLTTLEAMACGLPVITSDYCSMPELIKDGEGGYLCRKDSVDDFVERIKFLSNNPLLIKRMGEFNRKRIETEFLLDIMTQKYIELYKSLLKH